MKILAVRGKNLASLEGEFEIDFTREPLRSAGIFAITGSTGSGKSTILDALCLALFEETPRINKVTEAIAVNDVKDSTLSQTDVRNILRRGTGDGYAEVDFVALNGERFRSSWLVRRANGKAYGKLQKTELRLINLSTNLEIGGTKKEILRKIEELIGLTFNQFTRAVLLAQGEFSTFLKAKETDKAELLEKLTGTEIYSQISKGIYAKTSLAKESFMLIRQRMDDVKLLTDEEIVALNEQKQHLQKEVAELKNALLLMDKNLNWLNQKEQYEKAVTQAENLIQKAQIQVDNSKTRYEYLEKIEAVQEIRDTYLDCLNSQKQLQISNENLVGKQQELEAVAQKSNELQEKLAEAKTAFENYEKEQESLKPEIEKAKALDVRIDSEKNIVTDSQREMNLEKDKKTASEQKIAQLSKQLAEEQKNHDELVGWFRSREPYQEIIPRVELIVNYLNDAKNSNIQIGHSEKGMLSVQKILEIRKKEYLLKQEEAEKLNQLLPTEILQLRQKLTDGEACPVCGSIHHPIKNELGKEKSASINEQELEQAKQENAQSISQIEKEIHEKEMEITHFKTLIENYKTQYKKSISSAEVYLQIIENWENKIQDDSLQNALKRLAKQWIANNDSLLEKKTLLNSINNTLQFEQESLKTKELEFIRKKEIAEKNQLLYNNLMTERKHLLQGKSVEAVESELQRKHATLLKTKDELLREKENIEKKNATLEGHIEQIKKAIVDQTQQLRDVQLAVNQWLDKKDNTIDENSLADLVTKTHEWITAERSFLTQLENDVLSAKITLSERQKQLAEHNNSENKPGAEQNKESLKEQKVQAEASESAKNQQLAEISVAFTNHQTNQAKLKIFEAELNEKAELYENWQKLNALLGSADGSRFKKIAQGYTLDILLEYSNKHLEQLNKRYTLEKIPYTLALQVIDNDMLGEIRTVHSLSGGESFLISLALALGLSSLSSNRMKIESLFVDEGFGSLDMDTLTVAMEALENLQTQGRKIGVISHVAEMTERISTQVQVIKSNNGRSRIQVKSAEK